MPINRDPSTPPPMIGKIGPYTVFVTPPATPSPAAVEASIDQTKKMVVTPPPAQIDKTTVSNEKLSAASDASLLGFFKNALTKVQTAHSNLDGRLAHWFGLNQSKYQWALDDYYENKGLEKNDAKTNGLSNKLQNV